MEHRHTSTGIIISANERSKAYVSEIIFKCFERKHGVYMKKSLIQKDLLCDGNILLFDLYEKMHIVERKK